VIDEKTSSDRGSRMDFDPGHPSAEGGENPGHKPETISMDRMGQSMEKQRMKARVGQKDLKRRPCGGIPVEHGAKGVSQCLPEPGTGLISVGLQVASVYLVTVHLRILSQWVRQEQR
jgi:hypothetical protein